jgi:hypothetical protein
MAKRSIEIIISAENRTGTALQQAKAELAGYAADVKRIQANIAAATRAGDTGAAAGQMGLLGGARERQATLRQEVEGRAALSARLAAYKAEHAAIRASVGATDELAGSHRKVAEAIGQGTSRMSDMERVVSRIGGALAIAHMAAKGIGAAFEFGSAALKGEDLGEAAAKLMAGVAQGVPIAGGIVEPGGNFVKALHDALAGTGPEWQARIDKANAESLRAPIIAAEKAAAETRGQAQFDANVKALEAKRQAWMDQAAADKEVERVRKEEAADLEETHQRERRNVEYNNVLAAAAAKAQQEEREAAERKDDNERFRRESFEGLMDEEMTAAEKAASGIGGRYSPVSAFDRGFLTQAPGSTFDQSATAVATAKATETTAKATEKTAKAVETLTARQELLFRELLIAVRPGKVINF